MPAQLLALDEGPSILLDKAILLLGRHPECDIQIDSRKISRRHCCVAQVNDYLVVRDLGSTNGVRINGVRVLEGKLASGDELTIGTTRYQVTWESVHANGVNRKPPVLVKATPLPAPVEDDMLESSDEPVALPDPTPGAAPDDYELSLPLVLHDEHPEPARPPAASGPEPLLPEDLELLPISHVSGPQPAPPAAEQSQSL